MEEDIEKVEKLIKKCDECKLKECINCEISWSEIASVRRLIDNYKKLEKNSIKVSLVEEKLEKEKLPNIIVGGRRNKKTLDYGKKLGRIEICEELLEKRK